jgi:hypothetical protein
MRLNRADRSLLKRLVVFPYYLKPTPLVEWSIRSLLINVSRQLALKDELEESGFSS